MSIMLSNDPGYSKRIGRAGKWYVCDVCLWGCHALTLSAAIGAHRRAARGERHPGDPQTWTDDV